MCCLLVIFSKRVDWSLFCIMSYYWNFSSHSLVMQLECLQNWFGPNINGQMINYKEQMIESFRTCIDVVSFCVDIPFQCDLNDKLDHCWTNIVAQLHHMHIYMHMHKPCLTLLLLIGILSLANLTIVVLYLCKIHNF